MATIRVNDYTTTEVVDFLEKNSGPVRAWLHDKICGDKWSVTPYEDYLKVWMADERLTSLMILTL